TQPGQSSLTPGLLVRLSTCVTCEVRVWSRHSRWRTGSQRFKPDTLHRITRLHSGRQLTTDDFSVTSGGKTGAVAWFSRHGNQITGPGVIEFRLEGVTPGRGSLASFRGSVL